jgi:NAD dependent epimerase/dehydratase family enzyme
MNKAWIGAFWLKTDIELMLKSRRVVPAKLLDAGFEFEYPSWQKACPHLVERWRNREVLAA